MMTYLQRYYMAPFDTIKTAPRENMRVSVMVHVMLISLSQLYMQPFGDQLALWKQWVFISMGIVLIAAIQACIIDFIAAIWFRRSYSVDAFYLMLFSSYPFIIDHAISRLAFWIPSWAVVLFSFSVLALSATLQIVSIKHLYQISRAQAVWVFCLPIILSACVVAAVGIIMIV